MSRTRFMRVMARLRKRCRFTSEIESGIEWGILCRFFRIRRSSLTELPQVISSVTTIRVRSWVSANRKVSSTHSSSSSGREKAFVDGNLIGIWRLWGQPCRQVVYFSSLSILYTTDPWHADRRLGSGVYRGTDTGVTSIALARLGFPCKRLPCLILTS